MHVFPIGVIDPGASHQADRILRRVSKGVWRHEQLTPFGAATGRRQDTPPGKGRPLVPYVDHEQPRGGVRAVLLGKQSY